LTACKEAELLEPVGEDGANLPDSEAAYEGILRKIRVLKSVPPEIRFALQSQNTTSFLQALKNMPYDDAVKVLEDCVSSEILKLDESESLLFSFSSFFLS